MQSGLDVTPRFGHSSRVRALSPCRHLPSASITSDSVRDVHWVELETSAVTCRQNIEDALEKIQSALDRAADSIIPIEEDPEKKKQMAKQ